MQDYHKKTDKYKKSINLIKVSKYSVDFSCNNYSKEIQQEAVRVEEKINSPKDVENLVKELNDALAPMNTNLKFGVDAHDVFFVSVIEEQTNKMIRRFPAEQAQDFLPKMQEVTGILFDSKG